MAVPEWHTSAGCKQSPCQRSHRQAQLATLVCENKSASYKGWATLLSPGAASSCLHPAGQFPYQVCDCSCAEASNQFNLMATTLSARPC